MTKRKVEQVGRITLDPPILFVKPGLISDDDRATLKARGVVVIEVDPADARLVHPYTELPGGELLGLAATAIGVSENATKEFGRVVAAALAKKPH
jgi:hypothetical protein